MTELLQQKNLKQKKDNFQDYKTMQGLITDTNDSPNKETLEAINELENGGGDIFEGSTSDFLKIMLEDI